MKYIMLILVTVGTIAPLGPAYSRTAQGHDNLKAALEKMYRDSGGEIRYFDAYADLNGDGKSEAIVHVVGPTVCGTGGCETLIFTPNGDGYRLMGTIGLTRPPIVASNRISHGWHNLLVTVAGGGERHPGNRELRFDGRKYPENPTVAPAQRVKESPGGRVLIKDDSFKNGKLLHP